jgi:hypothetical protein
LTPVLRLRPDARLDHHGLDPQRPRAGTSYALGDRAACLKTLQPLAEDAALSDDGVKENYPPADAEIYLPVVRATRTNLKLCRG